MRVPCVRVSGGCRQPQRFPLVATKPTGIVATGVDTVVRVAGVTKPTLYAHFGSTSELVAATVGSPP